jgi:hypothetical protein
MRAKGDKNRQTPIYVRRRRVRVARILCPWRRQKTMSRSSRIEAAPARTVVDEEPVPAESPRNLPGIARSASPGRSARLSVGASSPTSHPADWKAKHSGCAQGYLPRRRGNSGTSIAGSPGASRSVHNLEPRFARGQADVA